MARALGALWFAFEDPKGVEIGPHFGARLHREVREIARRVGAPAVQRIVVNGANNASAMQLPRIGVFWPKNTLCLGTRCSPRSRRIRCAPSSLTRLGHMTHAHGRVASWVHRTRCADPRVDGGALARRLSSEPEVLRAFLAAKELRYSTGTLTVLAGAHEARQRRRSWRAVVPRRSLAARRHGGRHRPTRPRPRGCAWAECSHLRTSMTASRVTRPGRTRYRTPPVSMSAANSSGRSLARIASVTFRTPYSMRRNVTAGSCFRSAMA